MARIPHGQYTKELREEAVRLAEVEKLGLRETARRLSIPSGTLKIMLIYRTWSSKTVLINKVPMIGL